MSQVCRCIKFNKSSQFGASSKCGVYETEYGNAAVSDGRIAYDLDMGQAIPVELVNFSAFIRECDDYDIGILEEVKEGLRGIVVDKERANRSICERVKGTNLVHAKGVVGALSREQIDELCPTIVDIERPKYEERIDEFKRAVSICKEQTKDIVGADRVRAYIECMSKEAK